MFRVKHDVLINTFSLFGILRFYNSNKSVLRRLGLIERTASSFHGLMRYAAAVVVVARGAVIILYRGE